MKVPDSGHAERMLARTGTWILDGQAGMSKEGESPDYEYRRRLREHKVRSNRLSCMVMSASADMSVYGFILKTGSAGYPLAAFCIARWILSRELPQSASLFR